MIKLPNTSRLFHHKTTIYRWFVDNKYILITTLLFILLFTQTVFISQREANKREVKEELIELSMIKYGLFSIDEWKVILAEIISKKIDELDLTAGDREIMRKRISDFLTNTIHELERSYNKQKSKSISGFLQRGVASVTDIFGHLKKQVPSLTQAILEFIEKPDNRAFMKDYIIKTIDSYTQKTFAEIDYTEINRILKKHHYPDRSTAVSFHSQQLTFQENIIHQQALFLFFTYGLIMLTLYLLPHDSYQITFTFITLSASLFLAMGLLLPMIDIDARISSVSFYLLGESIRFQDQVIYFKSKSILEVVWLMLSQNKMDVLLVGILVLTFSVLFPVTKLITLLIMVYKPEYKSNRFIYFMNFKSGKWSMADVMVIAIFMAYIGFTGIITEQLSQVERMATSIDLLTTNESSLQIGFFMFTAFVVLSLFISHKIQTTHESNY